MKLVTWTGWVDGHPWWSLEERGVRERAPVPPQLRFSVHDRRCIGSSVDGERIPCSSGEAPAGRQCRSCQQADTFRPCMICDGFSCRRLSPSMEARCKDLHHLYLASFGGAIVKVGTASRGREQGRLVEQGPLAAARIASGSGPRIKQMEHLLAKQTPMVEAVRRARKLTLLSVGGRVEEARTNIESAYAEAVELLSGAYSEELKALDWFVPPDLAVSSREAAVGRTAFPIAEGSLVRGKLVGAVGPIALIDDEDARFLLDLGALVGRSIDLNPAADRRTPIVQLGLFA